jgi:hypothetical protein
VAEKVMGSTPPPAMPSGRAIKPFWTEMDLRNVPHYSTSIEAAWEVAERLELFKKYTFRQDTTHGDYVFEIDTYYLDGHIEIIAQAITIQLAICLAALRAVGVDV